MKLPGVQYGGVQSLGNPSSLIGAAGGVAQANIAATSNMVSAIKGGISAYDEYDRQQAENAADDNSLEMQRRTIKLFSDFDKEPYYSSDHPYVTDTPGFENDSRGMIPASELRGPYFRKMMEDNIEELAPNIHRETVRDDWMRRSEEIVLRKVGQFMAEGARDAKAERRNIILDQIDLAIDEEQYGIADELADTLPSPDDRRDAGRAIKNKREEYEEDMSEDLIDAMLRVGDYSGALSENESSKFSADKKRDVEEKIYKREETDGYSELRLTENKDSMRNMKDYLLSEEYDGMLSMPEREREAASFKQRVDILTDSEKAKIKRVKESVEADAGTTSDHLDKGYPVDPSVVQKRQDDLDAVNSGTGASRKLQEAAKDSPQINAFSRQPLGKQQAYIASKSKSTNDPVELRKLEKLEKAYKNNIQARENDIITHAVSLGMIKAQPIDYANTGAGFQKTWEQRIADYAEVTTILGAGPGPLSEGEVADINGVINFLPPDEKTDFIKAVYSSGSLEGDQFFEQLKGKFPSSYQMVAKMIQTGDDLNAMKVMQGDRMIDQMGSTGSHMNKTDAMLDIKSQMKNMFGVDTEAAISAQKATLSLLAFSQANGETLSTIDAIDIVTGGRIIIDGAWTVAPKSGVTQKTVNSWKGAIDPEYLQSKTDGKGFDGLTSVEVSYMLRDGEFKWNYHAPGQYWLTFKNANGRTNALRDKRGGIFILNYDESAQMLDTTMDKMYLKSGKSSWFGDDADDIKDEYRSK